jgi:hypothetical protein
MNLVKQREIIEAFAADCETGDFSQIGRTWSRFSYDLQGARGIFVVSDPKYDRPILPTDVSFATRCNLVGLIKSRQIGMIQDARSKRPFNYAGHIFADTNFVSYCNTVYSGKSLGAIGDAFYAAGDFLMESRGDLGEIRNGLGAMCYMVENFEQRHHPQVKNSLNAFIAFKLADADVFRRTRKICPTVSETEHEKMVSETMAGLETPDFKTIYEAMKLSYLSSRVALSKIASIELSLGNGKSAKQKVLKLFEYFHNEVAILPQMEMFAAWRFYEFKSQEPFFKMIQQNASDLLGNIHAMAWDFAHWRNIMMLVTAHSHLGIDATFPIPYFLTFDQGFARLLQQLQLKGIILLGSGTRYITVPDNQKLHSFSEVLEDVEHLLTPEAIADRQRRRPPDNALTLHYERLAQSNNQELTAMVNR